LRTSTKRKTVTAANYLERVNRAINYIETHLREPIRLRDVARAALLSPFHFHRVFQAVIGETPLEFAKRLRLDKALGLMAGPRPPALTAIALKCGFASSSDFSRCFKQRFGATPRAFDIDAWRAAHGRELEATVERAINPSRLERLPPRQNPEGFRVKVRETAARDVAYIRVTKPYQGDRVKRATERLIAWAEQRGLADGQWLGYQWDNPEITSLDDCQYYIAVEAHEFKPEGEVGRFRFPRMTVAEIEMKGGIDLELRALQWIYGTWLPRSGYVPDDQPGFEAFVGRPFAHGAEYFELFLHLPIRRP